MSARVHEIAPDIYRVSVFHPSLGTSFNHFLVKDDEPLLFHTGMRRMFSDVFEGVSQVLDPHLLRWIGFSHFEADECGSLNDWLARAPHSQVVHGMIGGLVNLKDFSDRQPTIINEGDALVTGKYRFRIVPTPQLPHGWDACMFFEETHKTLLCSDLFHQTGDPEPITSIDIIENCRHVLVENERGPFAGYVPYTSKTGRQMEQLASLNPDTLAIMHGSSYRGDCAKALRDLAQVFREVLVAPEDAAIGV